MILYDREDFYKLADVERVLGYKICTDRRHYLNAPDCWYEFDCECRHIDKYLVQVDCEDFILRTYAEQLITDKIKQDINVMHTYRFYDGKELRRRTPLYVHGTPMHPVTKVVNYRQKHKKSHR